MTRRLLDATPEGLVEYFHFDEAADRMTIETVHDVTAVIERNKALAAETTGYSPSRELKHVDSIPVAVLHKWRIEDGIDWADRNHWPAVLRKLMDPEWHFLRTSPGRI
jgi:hypothetical protein